MSKDWINYWSKKNIWGKSYIWKKNSLVLFNNIKIFFSITDMDILDIGCGTGELIENLMIEANSVCGVDISDDYLKTCKKKFKQNKKVRIKSFKNNYSNLYKMNQKFDVIFCNSVVQYFSSEKEIIELAKSVKKVSIKGTKFLISDIMDLNDKKNLFRFIFYSIVRGYFFSLIKQYIILLFNPKYRKLENKYKLLKIDTKKIVRKLKLISKNIKIIDYPLTINVNRKHILIEF